MIKVRFHNTACVCAFISCALKNLFFCQPHPQHLSRRIILFSNQYFDPANGMWRQERHWMGWHLHIWKRGDRDKVKWFCLWALNLHIIGAYVDFWWTPTVTSRTQRLCVRAFKYLSDRMKCKHPSRSYKSNTPQNNRHLPRVRHIYSHIVCELKFTNNNKSTATQPTAGANSAE